MCMTTSQVEIFWTKLFARYWQEQGSNALENWQSLAYLMDLEAKTSEPLAMILPVPCLDVHNDLALIDLSGLPNFFDDVESFMPTPVTPSGTLSRESGDEKGLLAVEKCGSFKVSRVSTPAELFKLDELFKINSSVASGLKRLLQPYFANRYTFIVAMLTPGELVHPIAFRWKTFSPCVFYPTMHFHGHPETFADYNHVFYGQNLSSDGSNQGTVPLDYPANELGLTDAIAPIDRMSINGSHLNRDIFVDVQYQQVEQPAIAGSIKL